MVVNAAYGILQLLVARAGGNLDEIVLAPLTGGASSINIFGAVNGASVFRPNAITGDPNHLADHARDAAAHPDARLPPPRARPPAARAARARCSRFLLLVELATLSRSGLLGLGVGCLVLALPVPALPLARARCSCRSPASASCSPDRPRRPRFFATVLRSRTQTGGAATSRALQRLRLHPAGAPLAPAVRARPEQLLASSTRS